MSYVRALVILMLILMGALSADTTVSADSTCPPSDSSYSATASVSVGRYTVYARFGKNTQQGAVTLTGTSSAGTCLFSGSALVAGSTWTPIATLDAEGGSVIFNFQSSLLANLPDANRPLVMLLTTDTPACTIDTECRTVIDTNQATIQPVDQAQEHSALHILIPQPLAGLKVIEVTYYADTTRMYTTRTLEPFDARMIPYYVTHTSRVITYSNGQQATITETLPPTHPDGAWPLVYRFWIQHRGVITAIGALLAFLIVQQIIKVIIYAIYRERRWRYAHGLLKDHLATLGTARERQIATMTFVIQKTFVVVERSLIYILIVGTVVFCISTFILQFTRVDGESMSPTLANLQLVSVNMTPVSVAHLNHTNYTPQRSELVAVHPLFGTAVASKTTELIVKRVIGLPGERVTVKNNLITIYNVTHPEGFNPDAAAKPTYTVTSDDSTEIDVDVTLSKDEVFLCGDNRPVSIDSRDNGAINVAQIVGIVQGLPFGIQ